MAFEKHKKLPLTFLFSIAAVETLVILFHFAKQASDTQTLFIYSPSRLLIISLLFFLFTGFAWSGIQTVLGNSFAQQLQSYICQEKKRIFFRCSSYVIGATSWVLYFTPAEQFGKLKNYITVARPLIALGILISIQLLIYLALMGKRKKNTLQVFHKKNRPFLFSASFLSIVFLLLWIFIGISGMGVVPNGEDWNEAGVPVLGWQVFIAMLAGLILLAIEKKLKRDKLSSKKFDILIFILIWAIGGYLWVNTPAPNGYLNPGPYPPTYETYPFADAARFDLMSQYALIGQGLNNGKAYNRPVYPAFLVYLHMLSGQSYDNNMNLQAALLALFPAFLYLVTKLISNRSTGGALATVIVLRGINGIRATNMINLANQKQMLTGFPTALVISLILLITLIWINKPNQLHQMVIVGGLFGLGIYLRQTILGFFPVIVLLPFLKNRKKKRKQFFVLSLFILGIIAFGLPYEIKNYAEYPNYRYPAVIRKIITVAEIHYSPTQENPASRERSTLREDNATIDAKNKTLQNISRFRAIGNHLTRNIVTSTLILPNSFSIDSLRNTIKTENSFWRASWGGHLNIEHFFFLTLNLALISIGVIFAGYRFPIAGWIPLLFFFGYNLANAFARSSGGRYIVPVDWIIVLYFVIGLFQLLAWVLSSTGEIKFISNTLLKVEQKAIEKKNISFAFLFVVVLGSFLILPDFIFPKKFTENKFDDTTPLTRFLYSEEKEQYVKKLLLTENIVVIRGQIMYPRYYVEGDGELSYYYPYKVLDYSRLSFILIGPNGTHNAIMPGVLPRGLANLSDAIVIGCLKKDKNGKYIDVGTVLITSEIEKAYFREPLEEPICKKQKP